MGWSTGRCYAFADLDQTTLSLDARINLTLSPRTTIELFAQPFLSSGDYENLKQLATPRTYSGCVRLRQLLQHPHRFLGVVFGIYGDVGHETLAQHGGGQSA